MFVQNCKTELVARMLSEKKGPAIHWLWSLPSDIELIPRWTEMIAEARAGHVVVTGLPPPPPPPPTNTCGWYEQLISAEAAAAAQH